MRRLLAALALAYATIQFAAFGAAHAQSNCPRSVVSSVFHFGRTQMELSGPMRQYAPEPRRSHLAQAAHAFFVMGILSRRCGCPRLGWKFFATASFIFGAAVFEDQERLSTEYFGHGVDAFNGAMKMFRNNECTAIVTW